MSDPSQKPLTLLSIVIPARDEEGCVASTIRHLHLELKLRNVPHEIIVVDDGSTDRTWPILQEEAAQMPELRPVQNNALHGFGRAITHGLDAMLGDAVVIMMGKWAAAISLSVSTSGWKNISPAAISKSYEES